MKCRQCHRLAAPGKPLCALHVLVVQNAYLRRTAALLQADLDHATATKTVYVPTATRVPDYFEVMDAQITRCPGCDTRVLPVTKHQCPKEVAA